MTTPDTRFNCGKCEFKKGMANPRKGVKIPGKANGKCVRVGGLCERAKVTAGND